MKQPLPNSLEPPLAPVAVGKQVTLQPPQRSVDCVSQEWNQNQHDQNRLPLSPPLGNVNQVAESPGITAEFHQLSQHHIAEGQPKQQSQRVEDYRCGQWR